MSGIQIDVISDVVCPWCFIGKRHLDAALARWAVENPDSAVSVHWHPYFLNPDTPDSGEPYRPFLEKKFGGPEKLAEIWARVNAAGQAAGIAFAFEKIELRANTLSAHRLIHHAQKVGAGGTALLVEKLFAAQFIDGRHVGDRDVLADIAADCGMDRAAIRAYLDTEEDADTVFSAALRAQRTGVSGVPFFIFNGTVALSGAQPPEAMLEAMRQATAAPPLK